MSWLSRAMNLMTFSVIFYRTKFEVLNAALLLPLHAEVVLQMLHVAIGLLSLSNLTSFHTADILSTVFLEWRYMGVCILPQIVLWHKCPYQPWSHSCISAQDIPKYDIIL